MQAAVTGLGVVLSEPQLRCFGELVRLVQEWSCRYNLTSITDTEGIELKHLADSLAVAAHGWRALSGQAPRSVLDIGSGAGFPVLPLAILRPEMSVTALEKARRKCEFVAMVAALLDLHVRVIQGHAQEEGRRPLMREKYDLVLARAVAYLPTLAEYCLPFVRIGGHFVAMKSESLEEEIADGIYAIERLGGQLHEPIAYTIPGLADVRYLLVVEKVARTPREYPRAGGVPKRQPLVG